MEKPGGGGSVDVGALPTQPSPAQSSPASIDMPHPRHYPLDVPDLPFRRFEHRLTTRDIMVHRIMADVMNPTRIKACTYDSFLVHGAFDQITRQDKELGAELRCLQKMLFTSYPQMPPPKASPLTAVFPSPHAKCCGILTGPTRIEGPRNRPPLLCDQILDLVRQHYFEADNAIFRAWISHLGPVPTPSSGPRTHTEPRSWAYNLIGGDKRRILCRAHIGRFQPRSYSHWTEKDKAHLQALQPKLAMQTKLGLYDGGTFRPYLRRLFEQVAWTGTRRGPRDNRWRGNDEPSDFAIAVSLPEQDGVMRFIMQPCWEDRIAQKEILALGCSKRLDLSLNPGRGRNRDGVWATGQLPASRGEDTDEGRRGRTRRRCASLPPPGRFATAYIGQNNPAPFEAKIQIIFPRMTLAQLDRRSRRRSLSRMRIEEMFDWDTDTSGMGRVPDVSNPRCENCAESTHSTTDCTSPCGHCGAPNPVSPPLTNTSPDSDDEKERQPYEIRPGRHQRPHLAPDCPVDRHNRCKCVPFPTFHVAKRCGVPCRRECGAEARPGTFQHPNAMLCSARCCMCGIYGHSGKDCRLRRCRCGQAHLGQDCGWKPMCRVKGCPRFWCGIHCRECGSTEKPFVEWRCAKCSPVPVPAAEPRGPGRRRKRPTNPDDGGNKGADKGGTQVTSGATGPPSLATDPTPAVLPQHPEHPPAPATIFGGPRISREGTGRDK